MLTWYIYILQYNYYHRLANTSFSSPNYHFFFGCVMRTFQTYSFSNCIWYSIIIYKTAVLYIRSPELIHLLTSSLYFLTSLSICQLFSPRESLCYSLFLQIQFFFRSHIGDIMQYLSYSIWLISLIIIPSRSICIVAKDKISFFLING